MQGTYQEAQLKLFRPRRQSTLEHAASRDLNPQCSLEHIMDSASHPCLILTTSDTNEEATVYIKDFDMFVCVELLDDSLAVLSLGLECETMGWSCSWKAKAGEQTCLIKDGITFHCES